MHLYLVYTTVDFVFHTLLQALQLVLEKCQVLKLGQRILGQKRGWLQKVDPAPPPAQVYQRLGAGGSEPKKPLPIKPS